MNRVGDSLFDQQGKIRSLVDVFGALENAYGQTASSASQASDFERAYGEAVTLRVVLRSQPTLSLLMASRSSRPLSKSKVISAPSS